MEMKQNKSTTTMSNLMAISQTQFGNTFRTFSLTFIFIKYCLYPILPGKCR